MLAVETVFTLIESFKSEFNWFSLIRFYIFFRSGVGRILVKRLVDSLKEKNHLPEKIQKAFSNYTTVYC